MEFVMIVRYAIHTHKFNYDIVCRLLLEEYKYCKMNLLNQ